jgi:hypothetical protein
MPARFDDWLPFFGDRVVAVGPMGSNEKIKEVCAWVFQPQGASEAAATEMTTNKAEPVTFQQIDGRRWLLVLGRISESEFSEGRAFAVGVALMNDLDTGDERVMWWGHPVELFEDRKSAKSAEKDGALERPPLDEPHSPQDGEYAAPRDA